MNADNKGIPQIARLIDLMILLIATTSWKSVSISVHPWFQFSFFMDWETDASFTPTVFRPPAQGCRWRLPWEPDSQSSELQRSSGLCGQRAVRLLASLAGAGTTLWFNPVIRVSQGRHSFLTPTLGWRAKHRWCW